MSANLGHADRDGAEGSGFAAGTAASGWFPTWLAHARDRLTGLVRAGSDGARARRLAGGAFAMRVVNAGLGFATQIVFARWMGESQYGIYAYIWVWLLFIGGIGSLGLPVSVLKFVPDYRLRGDVPGLRAFLRWSRLWGTLPSVLAALAIGMGLALAMRAAGASSEAGQELIVALIALVALPLYVLTDIQTGIARAYDWADLGLTADYLIRPVLILAFVGLLAAGGGPSDAMAVMAASLAAMALTAAGQGFVLQRRLSRDVPAGPARPELRRWASVSAPLLAVTTFILLLGSTDILVLKLFVEPDAIAHYFAATKIVAVASFVAYGVAATSSHRFAAHGADGDRAALSRLASETVRWTFWPTLAVVVGLVLLARVLLSLFGADFAASWPLVAILSLGLLAQAAVGPADRALGMLDEGGVTARIYAVSVAANLVLCLLAIPAFGLIGAAFASAAAMALKSILLFRAARDRLGLHMSVLPARLPEAAPLPASAQAPVRAELLTLEQAAAIEPDWRELAGRAAEPNPFYEPAMALVGLHHLPERQGARVLAAWRDEGPARRLVGLLPLILPRGDKLNPLGIRRAAEFYGTLSTPLIEVEGAVAAWQAMLACLDRAGICGLILPFLHAEGPAAAALQRLCATQNLRWVEFGRHERPMLRCDLPGSDYARTRLDSSRRRKLERQRRRLADEGALAFTVVRDEADVMAALDAFFALEGSGWKGRMGTDLAQAAGAADFMREAARGLARQGRFRVASLTVDGKPVAAGLLAHAGRRAFYLKIAFDERFAKLSPGIVHLLDLTAHLLDDPAIDDTDSIAVADHPLYRGIWFERFPIASVMVSTRPGGGPLFHAALGIERMREEARRRLKPLRARAVARLKGLRRAGAAPAGAATEGSEPA